MRLKNTKVISYLIVIFPLALVLTVSIITTMFYLDKVNSYFHETKQRALKEHIETKKVQTELKVKQLNLFFAYKNSRIQKEINKELKSNVESATESALRIFEKYRSRLDERQIKQRIIDCLAQFKNEKGTAKIFIKDFEGNQLLGEILASSPKNMIGRSLTLEEIQKVRKNGKGYLFNNLQNNSQKIVYVKNLGLYDWFIGSDTYFTQKQQAVKNTILDMIKSLPLEDVNFMAIYDDRKAIFLSPKIKEKLGEGALKIIGKNLNSKPMWHYDKLEDYYYYSDYFQPFKWHVVYGFDLKKRSKQELKEQDELEAMLDKELGFIIKISALIIFFVAILSLMLSKKINKIFQSYQNEVQKRADELTSLNQSLEQRVTQEVALHREKEKMLIQRSKMADMGDMLSMIAHQWRQPLNQMSYLLMNIESAYDHDELNKKYLNEKISQGNEILELMSNTIDDFRNYFRPDKDKELVVLSDLVSKSVSLIAKSLETSGIDVEIHSKDEEKVALYKNEFMQVILNLLKNSKDAFNAKEIQEAKIMIDSICLENKCIVKVCDNGGGIEEKIIDKIFEPYFSTKDKKNGTGLGLYMAKMIIEEHLNGKLNVYNTKNGVCFEVIL